MKKHHYTFSQRILFLLTPTMLFVLILTVGFRSDTPATGAFIETGGEVVFEAEHFTGSDPRTDPLGINWFVASTQPGSIGSYVTTQSSKDVPAVWDNGCELSYEVKFESPGMFNVYFRVYSRGGGENSVWLGMDGTFYDQANSGENLVWRWMNIGRITVDTPGYHKVQIRRREKGLLIDKMVMLRLKPGGVTGPSGDGPAESAREEISSSIYDSKNHNAQEESLLLQNYPNPFNTVTRIAYNLPQQSQVKLSVLNSLGHSICALADENQSAGRNEVVWYGQDNAGRSVASGTYYYRLLAINQIGTSFTQTRQMLLLR